MYLHDSRRKTAVKLVALYREIADWATVLASRFFDCLEDGGSEVLRIVGNHLPIYTTS